MLVRLCFIRICEKTMATPSIQVVWGLLRLLGDADPLCLGIWCFSHKHHLSKSGETKHGWWIFYHQLPTFKYVTLQTDGGLLEVLLWINSESRIKNCVNIESTRKNKTFLDPGRFTFWDCLKRREGLFFFFVFFVCLSFLLLMELSLSVILDFSPSVSSQYPWDMFFKDHGESLRLFWICMILMFCFIVVPTISSSTLAIIRFNTFFSPLYTCMRNPVGLDILGSLWSTTIKSGEQTVHSCNLT